MSLRQGLLFPNTASCEARFDETSSTFVDNMSLPVHRWFRYSAGFSSEWVERTISDFKRRGLVRVFDPFAGSGTTLLAAESQGVESCGIDSHPFVSRIAKGKLAWRTSPDEYLARALEVRRIAKALSVNRDGYPPLIYKCYDDDTLADLDALRRAYEATKDDSAASELIWLTIVAILRRTSLAGTAQWQYILPRKKKRFPQDAYGAFDECARMIHHDMIVGQSLTGPRATFIQADARSCAGVPVQFASLVVTSPPYPNNYDYADATRLEMSFMQEITGWGDLQSSVRQHLIRSCSQHVPERSIDLADVISSPELGPIRDEINAVCTQLSEIRKTKGGKKTYHLMVACYFHDLSLAWRALRRVCVDGSSVCFVIGDSAPYGVYVPVIPWLGALALASGFRSFDFERTRSRNVKWKNRKHRVPLQEGRLWVRG